MASVNDIRVPAVENAGKTTRFFNTSEAALAGFLPWQSSSGKDDGMASFV
jgi:hypothetical protein